MEITNTIITIIAIFITLLILDFLWLGIITKNFIISEFGSLIKVENNSIQINLLAGILTWLIIAIGVFIFAVNPSPTIQKALIMGAIFGFILYSVYDLTNLSFIKNYPINFIFVDIAWGTILCTILSAVGFYTKSLF